MAGDPMIRARPISFGGFDAVAKGHSDVDYVSGQFHAAYLLNRGNWYLKPLIDVAVTDLMLGALKETGGNGIGLAVQSSSNTIVTVSPAIELGTEMRFDKLSVWRPFVRAGFTWQDTDNLALSASFLDGPDGTSSFTINSKLDDVTADVGAGVDVINAAGSVMRVQYDGRFAPNTSQNSVSLKGSVPF